MQSPTGGFRSRFAATTVSAGAIGLMLLAFAAAPVDAGAPIDPDRLEHLESLLAKHNVRYALQMHGNACGDCDCTETQTERG